ncbi:hypothetical protein [Synechococcus sp. PCC 7335]|uniref:hypothetical protein n=1 Tax=Synechococcus sp. (strain ATCC 29403 / PCC 7335) TaxID=91464 RepID=UPI0002FA3A81|nr:hypothetical protein [Synechococcus sp. PCC 7335]
MRQLFEAAENLSPEERAELIDLLLAAKSSNVFVGVGTTRLTAQTVFQINMNSKEDYAQILKAVASKMQESSVVSADGN